MPLAIGLVLVFVLAVAVGASSPRAGTAFRRRGSRPVAWTRRDRRPRELDDPATLAAHDPIEALRRYGTAEDAARLQQSGVDLAALGYRPD